MITGTTLCSDFLQLDLVVLRDLLNISRCNSNFQHFLRSALSEEVTESGRGEGARDWTEKSISRTVTQKNILKTAVHANLLS